MLVRGRPVVREIGLRHEPNAWLLRRPLLVLQPLIAYPMGSTDVPAAIDKPYRDVHQ
jgi:hypothetical protein